jgi:putative ABC transport system permease protein
MLALLRTFSWQELRHHPWRNAAAVVAVMLGVALAFSVHLINASALGEFSSAVRAVNGQPDLELRSIQGTLDESLFGRVATHPQVALASPVLELSTYATGPDRKRLPVRVVGVDALTVAAMSPALMPLPAPGADRLALLAPSTVFLNPAAMAALVPGGLAGASGPSLQLQSALALRAVIVAGTVNAPGAPLAVMDIGAAQDLFGAAGRLSRIDLRLQPGTDRAAFIAALQLPAGVTAGEPGDAAERVSNLSRAYRVNLTVLALVALFTGAFLVFSVLSLSVARRAQQFALLGVLGLTPLQRLRLVLVESLLLGAAGSTAGIALGTALAALALRLLGGDLGGGFFAGVAPPLQWEGAAALLYGLLGVAAAGVGGWWPARAAQHLPPAQTLKGLGAALQSGQHRAVPLLLIAAGVLLAQTPPVAGIPLAAYVSVGLLLVGGITALPWLIGLTYDRLAPWVSRRLLPLLAVERARRVRESAAVAVSGVVASLSLAVALTVMVASFRDSVTHWLDVVLPADLYVRAAMGTGAADTVYFPPELVGQIAQLPGVKRLATQRFVPLQLDPARPAVALISRDGDGMGRGTALVGEALPVPVGQIGIWVSEAMVDLYGARPGQVFAPLSAFFRPVPSAERSSSATFFVAGVWRDYARQSGAIVIDSHDLSA